MVASVGERLRKRRLTAPPALIVSHSLHLSSSGFLLQHAGAATNAWSERFATVRDGDDEAKSQRYKVLQSSLLLTLQAVALPDCGAAAHSKPEPAHLQRCQNPLLARHHSPDMCNSSRWFGRGARREIDVGFACVPNGQVTFMTSPGIAPTVP